MLKVLFKYSNMFNLQLKRSSIIFQKCTKKCSEIFALVCYCDGDAKLPCPSSSAQTRFATSTKTLRFYFIKNKTIITALVGNGFLNNITQIRFNTTHIVHKLTNDVGRTSKGNQTTEFSTKSRQRPKGQTYSSQIKFKRLCPNGNHSQLKSKGSPIHQYT